jgi:cytoskeletal protein CcmA (bactofilin family)
MAVEIVSGTKGTAEDRIGSIGRSVVIKGELDGSEDLTIEGHVEGKIELRDHTLTIGANGRIKAQVFAKIVIVLGELVGNIAASERVEIRESGSVDGDIISPRVAIAEGSHFRGSIDMQRKGPAPERAAAAASPVLPGEFSARPSAQRIGS